MDKIFTKWIIDEIYDKIAEAKHRDLMKELNKEFLKKIDFYTKYKYRYRRTRKNKLYSYLMRVVVSNYMYYDCTYITNGETYEDFTNFYFNLGKYTYSVYHGKYIY